MARHGRDLDEAECYYQQSLELAKEIDNEFRIALALHNLGYIACYRDEHERARELFVESLVLYQRRQYKKGIAECLAGLAMTAASQGHMDSAARLCGAAEALLENIGTRLDTLDRADFEQTRDMVWSKLGDERSEALLAEGGALSLEQAITYAPKG
jgi:tetratricopeptide (TPR) repeat protein